MLSRRLFRVCSRQGNKRKTSVKEQSSIRRFHSAVAELNHSEFLRIIQTEDCGAKAVASTTIMEGTTIHEFGGPSLSKPTMHTVQLDNKIHVLPYNGAEYISHACWPFVNTRIIVSPDKLTARFVVTNTIHPDETICFDYNATEWDIAAGFICQCQECSRLGRYRHIRGYKHLSIEDRAAISHIATPFILDKAHDEVTSHADFLRNIRTS